MTVTKKLLIGCGLGCGTLVLVAILSAVSFAVWVARPGELLEPERLLGADTLGYLEWRLALEDPGTEGFAELLIESLKTLPPELEQSMPPWVNQWVLGRRDRGIESDLNQLFPMLAAWTLHAGEAVDDDIHLFSASLKKFGNRLVFADWLLGLFWGRDDETVTHRYDGERIYEIEVSPETKFAFFLQGGSLFLATDLTAARQAVDRLQATTIPGREATKLDLLFDRTERSDTMRGAVVNGRGEVERLLRNIWLDDSAGLGTEFWAPLHGVSLSAGLRADGALSGVLEFHGPDAAWATFHAASTATAIGNAFRDADVEPEIRGSAVADRIRIQFRIPELVHWLARLVEQDYEIDAGGGEKIRIDF